MCYEEEVESFHNIYINLFQKLKLFLKNIVNNFKHLISNLYSEGRGAEARNPKGGGSGRKEKGGGGRESTHFISQLKIRFLTNIN